ncbi:MAG: bifunctional precorrin-2 dehydrogenase/sirohydrochlorin ferrochelatase [bacterium]|nr:bifunctional precorrin-2 dehydrogenase/sirohydrochlorin ferrochelatase [bacterium]
MANIKCYYPLNVDIENKKCVVVGGGSVAERKVKTLLKYGAKITVISPKLTKGLKALKKKRKIIHINKKYSPSCLSGAFLAIGATDDTALNSALGKLAQRKNLLVNVVDKPKYGNFIAPAVVKRGLLNIAISTSGASPALAKKIRIDLEKRYGKEYKKIVNDLAKERFKNAHFK